MLARPSGGLNHFKYKTYITFKISLKHAIQRQLNMAKNTSQTPTAPGHDVGNSQKIKFLSEMNISAVVSINKIDEDPKKRHSLKKYKNRWLHEK